MSSSMVDSIFGFGREDADVCYYEILGCDELSTNEQIIAEYRAKAKLCHPDKVDDRNEGDSKFKKLSEAKEVLCDVNERKLYDQWRRSCIKMPFKTWKSLNANRAPSASMHWQSMPAKKQMISSSEIHKDAGDNSGDMTADEICRKFRNYEI